MNSRVEGREPEDGDWMKAAHRVFFGGLSFGRLFVLTLSRAAAGCNSNRTELRADLYFAAYRSAESEHLCA
jgi:hypothetical protein